MSLHDIIIAAKNKHYLSQLQVMPNSGMMTSVRGLGKDQKQILKSAKKNAGIPRIVMQSTFAKIWIASSEVAPLPDHNQKGTIKEIKAGIVQVIL